ncbi:MULTISPECIES: transglutaminase-like domain-containing protein [unclassified Candidatus Paralachnospira]|uniref:transglutaminase-like domain-containing protein n=1 Tax=unclassified Candidatus Paralachnospira TaxID=3099471 RepID=UPI003F9121A8
MKKQKSGKLNTEALQLVSVQTKRSIPQAAASGVLLGIFLAGSLCWLIQSLSLELFTWAPAMAAVVFAALQCSVGTGRKQGIRSLIWAAVLGVLALIFQRWFRDGIYQISNAVMEVLGNRYPYVLPHYAVTLEGRDAVLALTGTVVWLMGVCALAGGFLIRSENRFLLGTLVVLTLLLYRVTGIGPAFSGWIVWLTGLVALWLHSHGERSAGGTGRLAALEGLVLFVVLAALVSAAAGSIGQVLAPNGIRIFSGLRMGLTESLDKVRYCGSDEVLPNGAFTGLDSFKTEGKTVLEVTMSSPDSYYLRGFTGTDYTGSGWTDCENQTMWKNRDLFYWLHEEGLFGQELLGSAAQALGTTKTGASGSGQDSSNGSALEINRITVKNVAGNSKYLYVPYELLTDPNGSVGTLLTKQRIGDTAVRSGGFLGSREYSYEALSNQILQYPALTAALLDTESLSPAGEAYAKLEGYYNQFAYETCLSVPELVNSTLSGLLGEKNIGAGQKHTDYATAKQNILYVLTGDYKDTHTLSAPFSGGDLVYDFLENTKEGYSVHFASAAVLMFRYYGIPARYVEGYLITPEDAKAMTAGEAYALDDTHAHAWAEYYQDGVGWLPFEVTPSYLNVMGQAEQFQDISGVDGSSAPDEQQNEDQAEESPEEQEEDNSIDWLRVLTVLLIIGIILLILTLLAFLIWILIQRRRSRKLKAQFSDPDNRIAVRALFSYLMNLLSVAGLPIRNVSLYRYETALRKNFGEELAETYHQAVAIRQKAVYSTLPVSDGERRILEDLKNELWKQIFESGTMLQRLRLNYIFFL